MSLSEKAQALHKEALVWDMILPLAPEVGNDFKLLERFVAAGTDFVSLTIAGDDLPLGDAMRRLAFARAGIAANPALQLVLQADDILAAKAAGKLAVGLHLEGTRCLDRDAGVLELYYALGIRHGILAFNRNNDAAGGCAEVDDVGLSRYGRRLVKEMNRLGMIIDLSHTSRRSTLEVMEMTQAPVIITHSNADAVFSHYRNVTDEQIKRCAASGGVVGLSGSSAYLGTLDTKAPAFFRHLDHMVQLVGPKHVGIGTDFVADVPALIRILGERPDEWPSNQGKGFLEMSYMPPEELVWVCELMLSKGYSEADVRAILGENWLRVCRQVWR